MIKKLYEPHINRLKTKYSREISWAQRNKNVFIFLGGFLFDAITIKRIDALADLAIQIAYLLGLSFLIVYQYREHRKMWSPGKWVSKIWHYNVEILHFLYGGLFSAYVILYFKSTSGLRALLFLVLLIVLLIVNEMPQIRRFGYRLRLGLYAFCIASFLIYFVPILIGRMNVFIFILSVLLSAGLVWWVAGFLASKEPDSKKTRFQLYIPAAVLFLLIFVLYYFRLIPPVPLSVKFQGIYHDVIRQEEVFTLRAPKHPWYTFWRSDSQPFSYREGDQVHYFVSIYAPSRFKHEVFIRWSKFDEKKEEYLTSDHMPLEITGGRTQGFRGYGQKENYKEGLWKVAAETSDGRTIGHIKFHIEKDDSSRERKWIDFKR